MYVGPCFPCPPPLWVGVLRSLFALFACCRAAALRLLPSPASARAPRPRFAAPVRLMAPSSLSLLAGAGPLPFPPAPSLGPCAPLCGSVAARCLPCALASPRCAAGSLCGRPGCARGRLCASGWLAGSPLGRPLCGFGPGASSPGGCGRFAPAFLSRPRALFVLGCFAPCALPPVGGVLPCAPPVPAAPAGGSGDAQGPTGGPAGPRAALRPGSHGAVRQAVRFPIIAAAGKGPVWRLRRPCPCRCAFFGAGP